MSKLGRLSFVWVGMLVALATSSMPAVAQTPDDITPATEGVCDVLMGGTPGLYGLCVAFCEAQDIDDVIQEAEAGRVSGAKILSRYREKMAPGDPDMPCVVSADICPCFDIDACELAGGLECDLEVYDVAGVFAGRTCNVADECYNDLWPDGFYDLCISSGMPYESSSSAMVYGDPDEEIYACEAVREIVGTPLRWANTAVLDYSTALVCSNQLNTYDGNWLADGYVPVCGLAD